MRRLVGAIPILLVAGCGAVPQQPATLPAPLEGEMVAEGHLCDPSALAQAVVHKYPRIDKAEARKDVDHLLYVLGCGAPSSPAPSPFATPSPAAQPVVAHSTPYLRVQKEAIPLRKEGNTYSVPVLINGIIPLAFVLDTGAGDVLLPFDVVFTLVRTGTLQRSDFISDHPYVLADGRELPSVQFKIRELQVGQHTVHNVTAGVGRLGSDPLLGQSFLSRFGSATIDYNRNVLVLTE